MDWNEFLHEAVSVADIDLVRQALAQGADPNGLGEYGTTTLYRAVSRGDTGIVRALLKAGARVALESEEESHALHAAVEDNNLSMINLLMEYEGAATLNKFDYVERTPLIIAVQMGNVEMARRLIEVGADVNAHNEPKSVIPLYTRLPLTATRLPLTAHWKWWNYWFVPGPTPRFGAGCGLRRWTRQDRESGEMGRVFMNCWSRPLRNL